MSMTESRRLPHLTSIALTASCIVSILRGACIFLQRARDDDMNDDPLLDDFKVLRRRVFQWQGEPGTLYGSKLHLLRAYTGNTGSHLPSLRHGRHSYGKATDRHMTSPIPVDMPLPDSLASTSHDTCRLGICGAAHVLGAFPGSHTVSRDLRAHHRGGPHLSEATPGGLHLW